MSLINSPWLSDWRRYADETDMAPKARRAVEAAIGKTEQTWQEQHAQRYRSRAELRFHRRDEQVVGVCEDLCDRLHEIRSALASGRMTPAQARSEIRTMRGRHAQVTELHDTIVAEEPEMEAFASMTPDDYQRHVVQTQLPALLQTLPTLAGVVADMTPPPPPGGSFEPIANPPAPGGTDLALWESR